MVVLVVLMRIRVDWSGVKISIDIWVCCMEDSGGVFWFEIDIVMLNRWRFFVFIFLVVEMVLVLVWEI